MKLANNNIDFLVLDGLRGIAALYVVINHSRAKLHIGGSQYAEVKSIADWTIIEKVYFSSLQVTTIGREFVIFFFVLSGFSIAHSLSKNNRVSLFMKKRIIRLYPPYILALLWAGIVFYIIDYNEGFSVFSSWNVFTKNLLYIPTGSLIVQFWSLPFEIIFYLSIPFFIKRLNYYYLFTLILWLIGWFIAWNGQSGQTIITQFLLDYNIYFALGIYVYQNFDTIKQKLCFRSDYLIIISISIFIILIGGKFLLGDVNKITKVISALFSVILIVNFLDKRISNGSLKFIGQMSYTLYITHWASIFLFKYILIKLGIIDSSPIRIYWIWYIGVLFCLIIAYVFFWLVENRTKSILMILRSKE